MAKTEEELRQHWREVKQILNKARKRHPIIWSADENGQIGRKDEMVKTKQASRGHSSGKIIAQCARAESTEKGNGAKLLRICQRQQTIPMTTWEMPKIAQRGKRKRKKLKENMTKENGTTKYMTNTTTWTIPDGNTRRQLGYFAINAKRRNKTKKGTCTHLACQHEPESTTPSTGNADLLQRRDEIKEADTSRKWSKITI